jgi:MFS family permease
LIQKLAIFLHIKEDEQKLIFKLFTFSIFIGLATAFLKTIADAAFIIQFGIAKVPEAIVIGGGIGYLLSQLIIFLNQKFGFEKSTSQISFASAIILSIFCFLLIFYRESPLPIYWLFIISMPLANIIENIFNSTIIKYLDFEQNKRLSGILITGSVISGIVGSFIIPLLKNLLPTKEYLLLFSAIGCILFAFIYNQIKNKFEVVTSTNKKNIVYSDNLPFKNRYFIFLSLFILISAGLFYIINFGFLFLLGEVKSNYNADKVLLILAIINGLTKLLEFIFSLLSGKILSKNGISFGLLALPFVLTICIALAFIFTEIHQFWFYFSCIVLAKLAERSVRKGLLRPSINVLYQLFDEQKTKIQQFLDGNVTNLSALFFGVLLWILTHREINDLTIPYSFFTAFICIFWCGLAILVIKYYRKELLKKVDLPDYFSITYRAIIDKLFLKKLNFKEQPVYAEISIKIDKPIIILPADFFIPITKKTTIIEENEMVINFSKLHFLLATSIKMENNPFYEEMAEFFNKEIIDEVNLIGKQLNVCYGKDKLNQLFYSFVKNNVPEERLYIFELLSSIVNKSDKKNLSLTYNLINKKEHPNNIFRKISKEKFGLRSTMKNIISEKEFTFSSILKTSAMHVLGQNYIVTIPKEILKMNSSKNPLMKEMSDVIIEKDINETKDLKFGEEWIKFLMISQHPIFHNLGNYKLEKLYLNVLQKQTNSFDLENEVILIPDGLVTFLFNGNNPIDTLKTNILSSINIKISKIENYNKPILFWKKDDFLNIIN